MSNSDSNIPELRFSGFNSRWEKSTLESLSTRITDGTHDTPTKLKSGVPFLTAIHVKDGMIDFDGCYYVSKEDHKTIYKRCDPEYGDLLMVNIGAGTATSAMINVDYEFSLKNVALIKPNREKVDPVLFSQIQRKKSKRLQHQLSSGGAQPFLSLKQIKKLEIILPESKPEQQKIASFLSAVDTKIEQLTRKKELLEQYKKGVMQKLFPKPGEQHPELRFKQEDGSDFPDWEVKRLGELTFKVGRKNKENIPYPIYSINNQEGFLPQAVQFEGLDSVDRGYDISMYKIIHPETFAYNPARINVGSIGYSYDLDKVIISSLYVCFKTKPELADEYLLAFIDTYQFNNFVLRYQEGGVRQYLFYENFSSIKLPLPSVEEQQKIAGFLIDLDRRISEMNNRITKTQTFKKGLLQQMFV